MIAAPPLLIDALVRIGLDWARISAQCEQIVLFGSRADGRVDRYSDWDLLCVGRGVTRSCGGIDLIWATRAELECRAWLGRELAGHIASYGVWLAGVDDWSHRCAPSQAAIAAKARRITRRVSSLERHWDGLAPRFQRKHADLVRRDLQRHDLLQDGLPVPSRPVLDMHWSQTGDREAALVRWSERAGVGARFFRERLAAVITVDAARGAAVVDNLERPQAFVS